MSLAPAAYDALKANCEPGGKRAIGAAEKDRQDSPPEQGAVNNIISRAKTGWGASDLFRPIRQGARAKRDCVN